jgi:deoxyribodipyrimidine photo-lyase
MSRSIVWFRRDLRLSDHPALAAAAAAGEVAGVFVLDPSLLREDSMRVRFLLGCLAALNEEMNGSLWVHSGKPAEVIPALANRLQVADVYVTADCAPYGRRRDDAVSASLERAGRRLVSVGSPYAVDPGVVLNGSGLPYRVFTPYAKAWESAGWARPQAPPTVRWTAADPQAAAPPRPDDLPAWAAPGERAALDMWERFFEDRLEGYDERRDFPGLDATSGLSPYLRFGCIHPRTILAELADSRSHRRLRTELAWREFYADVLFHRPDSAWQSMQPTMRAMRCDTDAAATRRFEAWCGGQTGFPIVDAGMRQLLSEGFIHNRVRMIVASFLVKDLHLPWQWGARHFQRYLIDFDLASNNHGWQWVAGTGTDAAPYYRIFNPHAQQARFDPDATYVDRWAGAGFGIPIVDHAIERIEALARLAELR